jgi:dihydrofolate reductase
MDIVIVVATDRNGLIGKDGGLPWRLPGDLKRFRALTTGYPVIMGRATWDSIGKPLPGRDNIVVSRTLGALDGAHVVASPSDALDLAATLTADREPAQRRAMVIGGATIYRALLRTATHLNLTVVEAELAGDTHFPPIDRSEWVEESRERFAADEKNAFATTVYSLARRARTERAAN